jgi:hypothetical protein
MFREHTPRKQLTTHENLQGIGNQLYLTRVRKVADLELIGQPGQLYYQPFG